MLALIGIAAIPAVSDALVPSGVTSVHVSVKPPSGSPTTHFAVSFRAAQNTGIIGGTAHVPGQREPHGARGVPVQHLRGGAAGARRRDRPGELAPKAHGRWCAGTFHGQVWKTVFPRCPAGKACPALVFPPLMVGKFSFRVTRS